jgi:NAD-dependent DNA ligase
MGSDMYTVRTKCDKGNTYKTEASNREIDMRFWRNQITQKSKEPIENKHHSIERHSSASRGAESHLQALLNVFNRAHTDDRLINELIGISRGILADGAVDQGEAEFLQKWLENNQPVSQNLVIANLLLRVDKMLADDVLDSDESKELLDTLHQFTGGDVEIGELLKSTTLPFNDPLPDITIHDNRFCFTGTFAFGSRKECESVVDARGGSYGGLAVKTDYLVIGVYATDRWVDSSYGRNIKRAVEFREAGYPISIVGEEHWLTFID